MESRHLEIYDFGPIKEAKLDFTRVNVIIGPQSAGKSCILKIACHCAWTEKMLMVLGDAETFQQKNYFFEQLIEFHKLQGYVTDSKMRIVYKTSLLTFEYNHADKRFSCDFAKDTKAYRRAKLSYIPAERNVISTVPNWMELSYGNDNISSFMSDWSMSRREFSEKTNLPILSLGAEYFYDKAKDADMVKINGMKDSLPMLNVSSGLQSLIPIMLYVHYLTHSVFKDTSANYLKKEKNLSLMIRLYKNYQEEGKAVESNENKQYVLNLNNRFLYFATEKDKNNFRTLYNNYTEYQYSNIFLEEPEENLFPETQAEVMYHLLKETFSSQRKNSLFIATHSPYILYALNNAILANIVRDKMPKAEFPTCGAAKFKATDISVWQISDGLIGSIPNGPSNTIQDKNGLIRKNYLNDAMKNVMADFTNMLSYRNYE